MNHGFKAHVHLSATNDLSDIAGVIGLKYGNFDAFVGKVAQLLSQVKGGVVWRSVPAIKPSAIVHSKISG